MMKMSRLAYDEISKRLTFELTFSPVDYELAVPVDFNFDLSPIGNIGTVGSPDITLGAGIDLSITLGLDLSDNPQGTKDLTEDTRLIDLSSIDDLADAIKTEYSLSPEQMPSAQLSGADTVDIEFIDAGAEMTGSPRLEFNHFDATADTIVRNTGSGSWLTDGFREGQLISVTGTSSNNGTYTIAGVSGTEIILVDSDELTEEDKSGVKVTGAATQLNRKPRTGFFQFRNDPSFRRQLER